MHTNLDLIFDEIGVPGSNYPDFANFVLRGISTRMQNRHAHAEC